ncbi:hypothetical protein CCM_07836 [Cordyceps militaris CM01]|uniref:Uncharacterized protein n=1 Tax=Cordyceps militaris (strain CM01) TaxID=983644 RepID=G3JNX4_CORMM|nr:uncharacterized protein CCM_07836 [Cordyceps militaris CM01]EGX89584.1 hypothetical protein CCM_07836 [Cordyceps militaris CM01]
MDTIRILDQQIDRSLWPIEPTEAAQYHFIWTAPKKRRAGDSGRRRPREDDERTIASAASAESDARNQKGSATERGTGLLRVVRRSVIEGPRRRMQKLLGKGHKATAAPSTMQEQECAGQRRWSEVTLVECGSRQEERKGTKEEHRLE